MIFAIIKNFTHRPDDNEETVKDRLDVFHQQTAPLIPYYQQTGILQAIDGMAEIMMLLVRLMRWCKNINNHQIVA